MVLFAIIFISLIYLYDLVFPEKKSEYIGQNVIIQGEVTDVKSYVSAFGGKSVRIQLESGQRKLEKVLVELREEQLPETEIYGRTLRVSGILNEFEEPSNPAEFNRKAFYENLGFRGIIKADDIAPAEWTKLGRLKFFLVNALKNLNRNILEKYKTILGEREAGSLSAMVLGDKSLLDAEIKELYQENSISHLLSISGLHISIVSGAILIFLKKLRMGFKSSLITSGLVLIFYGFFTGFSVSTARAVIMMCIIFFSFLAGRSYDLPSSLAFSAIIILLINHKSLYQTAFQLSYLSVIGIFYIMPELNHIFNIHSLNVKGYRRGLYYLLSSLICSVSVTIATLPVILGTYYEISMAGILLNIAVVPLMALLVVTGLAGGFISLVSELAGRFFLGTSYYILNFYTVLCNSGNKAGALRIITGKPEKWQIAVYYITIAVLVYLLCVLKKRDRKDKSRKDKNRNRVKRICFAVGTIALSFVILTHKKEEFSLNMLDIGQGDCFVMSGERGEVYISDCGSSSEREVGKYKLLPFLKYNGWGRIKGIFVSHADKDHISGIIDLLKCEEIKVDKIFVSESYKNKILHCEEFNTMKMLANNRKISLYYLSGKEEIRDGKFSFLTLYPEKEASISIHNEASIVMRMSYENLSVLFTGDIGKETEKLLLERVGKEYLDCDILKVGHHGSRHSSSSEFLEAADPAVYLISAGKGNSYGHPHKEALERMAYEKGEIYSTDKLGAVRIGLKDGKLSIWHKIRSR